MCCWDSHSEIEHAPGAPTYPNDKEKYCVCEGTNGTGCCGEMTGPDKLCDRCREYCEQPPTIVIDKTEELIDA